MAAVCGQLFCGMVAVHNSGYWGSYRFIYRLCYTANEFQNEFHEISHSVSSCKLIGKEHP